MRLADQISLRSRRRKFAPLHGDDGADRGDDGARRRRGRLRLRRASVNEGRCGTLNFFEEHYPWPERITALGLHEGDRFRARYPDARYVQGDALQLPFDDGSFDVVFSNAVIEHVGGEDEQRRFVAEALRVGRRAFVTTPNRWFPVEVHTRLPLVHWLPDAARAPRLRPRAQAVGEARTTCSAPASLAQPLPAARCGSSTSGSRSWSTVVD